jgi:hypothetical protein
MKVNQIEVPYSQRFSVKMNLGNMTPAQYERVQTLLHSFNHIFLTNPQLSHPVLDGIVFSVSNSTDFKNGVYCFMSCQVSISHTSFKHSERIDFAVYLPTYKNTDELEDIIVSAENHIEGVIKYVIDLAAAEPFRGEVQGNE